MGRAGKWMGILLAAGFVAALALLLISRHMEGMKAVLPLEDAERTAAVYRMAGKGQDMKHLAIFLLKVEALLGLGYLAAGLWAHRRRKG
jgi:hypothetical protein